MDRCQDEMPVGRKKKKIPTRGNNMIFANVNAVPIWMGESGENTDEWISQFTKTLERKQHRMGFLAI